MRQSDLTRAWEAYDTHRLVSAFGEWRVAAEKIKRDREVADKARAFFALRQVFRVWKAAEQGKRQERWAEQRRMELVGRIFKGKLAVLLRRSGLELTCAAWREETKRSVEGKRLADDFRFASDHVRQPSINTSESKLTIERLVVNTLANWTTRVIFLKSRQLDVTEQRDTRLLQSTLTRWIQTRRRIANGQALADSFVLVKGEETVRDVMGIWRDKAARKRERREAEVVAEQSRKKRLVQGAWEVWRDRAAEKRLGAIVSLPWQWIVRQKVLILAGGGSGYQTRGRDPFQGMG
jgi:protein SFI1